MHLHKPGFIIDHTCSLPLPYRSLLAEDQSGGSLCPPGSTNMAVADMVPTGTGDVGRSTSNFSKVGQSSSELTKRTSIIRGHLTLAAWPIYQGSLSDQGFSEGVAAVICASWRKGTENHTIQPGDNGFAGVVQGKLIQFFCLLGEHH